MLPERYGPFTLLRRLGRGGMAEVFLARATSAGGVERLLAIKRLLPHYVTDSHVIDLLTDEARIATHLNHRNIVQVFDFGWIDETYYLAMEYVAGVDLRTFVTEGTRIKAQPLDVAFRVVVAILDALDYAHRCIDEDGEPLGIIHRDVSPHNVLISKRGQVKLADFGVARARISSHVSVVGDVRGKFSYMPPEQALGRTIDARVDVFAAGAILYELLSGRPPYRSTSSGEQLLLLSRPVAPPSHWAPTVPAALDSIALKALQADPERRFATAGDFADALNDQIQQRYGGQLAGSIHKLADRVELCLRDRSNDEEHRPQNDFTPMGRGDFVLTPGGASLIADSAPALSIKPTKALRKSPRHAAVPAQAGRRPRLPEREENLADLVAGTIDPTAREHHELPNEDSAAVVVDELLQRSPAHVQPTQRPPSRSTSSPVVRARSNKPANLSGRLAVRGDASRPRKTARTPRMPAPAQRPAPPIPYSRTAVLEERRRQPLVSKATWIGFLVALLVGMAIVILFAAT